MSVLVKLMPLPDFINEHQLLINTAAQRMKHHKNSAGRYAVKHRTGISGITTMFSTTIVALQIVKYSLILCPTDIAPVPCFCDTYKETSVSKCCYFSVLHESVKVPHFACHEDNILAKKRQYQRRFLNMEINQSMWCTQNMYTGC